MRLYEQGKIDLDAPVTRYLQYLPGAKPSNCMVSLYSTSRQSASIVAVVRLEIMTALCR